MTDSTKETATIFNIQKCSLQDGPGIRTSVFLSGCPLRCRWCANPECHTEGETYTADELFDIVCRDKPFYDKSGGGVTLTGGEVFDQFDFAFRFCGRLRAAGIHTAIETAGCVDGERFRALVGQVDFVFMDAKHYDDTAHRQGTGVGLAQIRANLTYLAGCGVDYCVRIPVIPGFNDAPGDARGFAAYFQSLGVRSVELLPFHQFGEGKYEARGWPYAYAHVPPLHREDLTDYRAILEEAGISVTC